MEEQKDNKAGSAGKMRAKMGGWVVGWSVGWLVASTHGNEEALASFYTWPVGRRRFIYTAAIAFKTSPS